ncbi:MAG TPA: DedA family protein [Candidatus Thermoplasmatota archaeon]|nr:DedA family protein [Candidatus Thermoplasmatota archaeon]
MSSLTEALVELAAETMHALGYFGVYVLMVMESFITPIPSMAVMPTVGFLVADGRMELGLAILASSAGSLTGSLVGYATGARLGRPALLRYGRYFLLHERHLRRTEELFARYGGAVVFVGRFLPVVRHLISIPAGMGRMPLPRFVAFTLLGATAWNCILLVVGMTLRSEWHVVRAGYAWVDYAVVAALAALVVWWVVSHRRRSGADVDAAAEPAR